MADLKAALKLLKGAGITIPKKEFVKEHTKLVGVLTKGTKKQRLAEAKEQAKELALKGGALEVVQEEGGSGWLVVDDGRLVAGPFTTEAQARAELDRRMRTPPQSPRRQSPTREAPPAPRKRTRQRTEAERAELADRMAEAQARYNVRTEVQTPPSVLRQVLDRERTGKPIKRQGQGKMVGSSRNSGFIQRMMAEVKKKHDGEYKNPTAPLAEDTEMNAPVAFDYFAMPSESRAMSKFIMDHFFRIRPYRAGEREQLNEYELKKLRDAEAERQRRSRARRRGGAMRGGSEDSLANFLETIQNRLAAGHPHHLSNDAAWGVINEYLDNNEDDDAFFTDVIHTQGIDTTQPISQWIGDVIEHLRLGVDTDDEMEDADFDPPTPPSSDDENFMA